MIPFMKRISLCVVLMLYLFSEAVYASGEPFNNPFDIAKKNIHNKKFN